MKPTRLLLALGAACILVAGLAPIAQAAQVGAGVCIERHETPGPQNRLRDTVERPDVDRLQGWIAKHPKLADRAAQAVAADEIVTIRTWIHVIRADTTVEGGNVPRAWIDAQIDVLNASFSGETGGNDSGFRFALAGVTRTSNADWYDMHSQGQDRKMKLELKRGGLRVLNIYTVAHRTLLGYAYLAQDAAQVDELDGVVVDYRTLPGGGLDIYSEGDTATHEVGHWLDLFHTFDGGCNRGDQVADTAPEASPAFNCPVGRDTCEGDDRDDPIRNFMDYTQDSCMFRFSNGQGARMRQAWAAFRA